MIFPLYMKRSLVIQKILIPSLKVMFDITISVILLILEQVVHVKFYFWEAFCLFGVLAVSG